MREPLIPQEDACPEIVRDGDEAWITAVVDGARIRVCKISAVRAVLLNKQLGEVLWALLPVI